MVEQGKEKRPVDWMQVFGLALAGGLLLYSFKRPRVPQPPPVPEANPPVAEKVAPAETTVLAPKKIKTPPAEKTKETPAPAKAAAVEKAAPSPKAPLPAAKNKKPAVAANPPTTPPTTPPATPPATGPRPVDVQPETAPAVPLAPPDVVWNNSHLRLTFTARGAALSRAVLTDEYVTVDERKKAEAGDKSVPGLELLDEIEPGKLSLALAEFRFGGVLYDDMESFDWRKIEDRKENDKRILAYSCTEVNGAFEIVKRFVLGGEDRRHLTVSLTVINKTKKPASYAYVLRGPAGILLDGPPDNPKQGAYVTVRAVLSGRAAGAVKSQVAFFNAAKLKDNAAASQKLSMAENVWAGVKNRFFVALLAAEDPAAIVKLIAEPIHHGKRSDKRGDKRYAEPNATVLFYRAESKALPAGKASAQEKFDMYLGPAQNSLLTTYEEQVLRPTRPINLAGVVQYCDVFGWSWPTIDWISRGLAALFIFLHGLLGSYGFAVILLTLVIKGTLHPLQRKMMVSMHKMQKIQPQLKAIEAKYKGQTAPEIRRKMEMEKWNLMRKTGANPAMGCLPMFVQMPVFFSLYGVFSRAFELRQAGSFWIEDLSLPDRFIPHLAFWPGELNLLPLIYVALSVAQSLAQPKAPDPQQDQQRKMMMFLPVVFGFLFYRMPAGLVLYFAASSVFAVLESWLIKKYVIKDEPQPAAAGVIPPAAVPVKAFGKAAGGGAGKKRR